MPLATNECQASSEHQTTKEIIDQNVMNNSTIHQQVVMFVQQVCTKQRFQFIQQLCTTTLHINKTNNTKHDSALTKTRTMPYGQKKLEMRLETYIC